MSIFSSLLKQLSKILGKKEETKPNSPNYNKDVVEEIHSIWDYLKFIEHTQAHHICSILGFEEWIEMEEVFRRVKEIFGVEYKNERSLYPYIKTLVDCGLIETTAVGGKRKWRKKDILIKITKAKKTEEEEIITAT